MEVTRRFWLDVALLVVLVILAVVLSRPILLVGAAIVGAWLLAAQYQFARMIVDTSDRLEITQSISQDRIYVQEETTVNLGGTSDGLCPPISLSKREYRLVSPRIAPPELRFQAGSVKRRPRSGSSHRWLDRFSSLPVVTVEDSQGRFTEQFDKGPTPDVDVEPGPIRNVHIGQQARQVSVYGDHNTPELGSGFDLADLREYVPGDPANRIDWKATARLSTRYVREFETETDRRVALLIDHRSTMGDGRPGETKPAYARHVALMFVNRTRESNDPIGCYAIDEDGITVRLPPSANRGQYTRVRNAVSRLEPTTSAERYVAGSTATEVRRKASRLDDESAFAAQLRPYFADSLSYHEGLEHDPLSVAVRTYIHQLRGPIWTALFTDDTRRTEVREAVTLARRNGSHVLVFLTPTVLFKRDALDNLDAAYERYAEFEQFRRSLNSMERVSAFELAPTDRLQTVLSAGRTPNSVIQP
ncbi:DUF58 domain-containing protein [Halalkalicoccus salilacus]|uniref:DUF58 domain-containing protein n=1 Tax=Halalkalicoccus sp. GCM10025704 TaxID=3252662 RepID=UPI00361AA809